ncbi:MAG: hypothetical protein ACRYF4_06710 [Janthinobacterium lividum]
MMNPNETQHDAPGTYLRDLHAHGFSAALLGSDSGCTDQVVGDILSSWRYDLTAVSPEVRGAYLEHFAECRHCRARRRLHRSIDLLLLSVFTASAFIFLIATMILHRGPWAQVTFAELHMRHVSLALTLQSIAVGGLLFSVLMWVLVAIATPAPGLISHTMQQRRLQARERTT